MVKGEKVFFLRNISYRISFAKLTCYGGISMLSKLPGLATSLIHTHLAGGLNLGLPVNTSLISLLLAAKLHTCGLKGEKVKQYKM